MNAAVAPVVDLVRALTLKEAIFGEYDQGVVDPHEVAQAILTKYDDAWLATILLEEAEEIIADKARFYARDWRRNALAVVGGEKRTSKFRPQDFLSSPVYVEGFGWKSHSQLTAAECEIVAGDYDRRAADIKEKGSRYRKFAALIREQNVKTLGKAKGVEALL